MIGTRVVAAYQSKDSSVFFTFFFLCCVIMFQSNYFVKGVFSPLQDGYQSCSCLSKQDGVDTNPIFSEATTAISIIIGKPEKGLCNWYWKRVNLKQPYVFQRKVNISVDGNCFWFLCIKSDFSCGV